jgi:hypothetical protein
MVISVSKPFPAKMNGNRSGCAVEDRVAARISAC